MSLPLLTLIVVINACVCMEVPIHESANVTKGIVKTYSISSMENGIHVFSTVNSKDADVNYPVLFVVRQQKSVLSWEVPYIIQTNYIYNEVSHTLCPENGFASNKTFTVIIDVSTSSTSPLSFTLDVTQVNDFQLRTQVPQTFDVSPSNPKYYLYSFPPGRKSMIVKVKSSSDICAVVSVQSAECPVYDQFRNIEFVGQFQTMTTSAAITVQKSNYNDGYFFVVVVAEPSDSDCLGRVVQNVPIINASLFSLSAGGNTERNKSVTVTVDETLPSSEYWKPLLTTMSVLLSFYIITGIIMYIHHRRNKKKKLSLDEEVPILSAVENEGDAPLTQSEVTGTVSYGTTSTGSDLPQEGHALHQMSDIDHDSDDEDIDMLEDMHEEKQIYRTKMTVCVADLARKKPKTLDRKYKLYYWNLLTIAVFYSLPVVQLVITYQSVLNMSGDEDTCYYNFLCAMPGGVLSAFNNVFSNIGYVMLGLLYLIIVRRKHNLHKKAVAMGDVKAKNCGIPKHFGLFYSLGVALVMEGVLSGSYHVCPNYSNFQFDTAFMYIISGLGMLVLYQQRHPDVNPNAYAAFATFAAVIFIALMGVLFVSVTFYAIFAVVHILTCLAVSAQMYYMGTWKLDLGIFKRAFVTLKTDCFRCTKPVYIDRMIFLIIGNAVNWAMLISGLIKMSKDFNSFLLALFLVNLLLYLAFYIIMKVRSGEHLTPLVAIIIVTTLIVWGFSLYFYTMGLTGWEKTPALSRESNAPCMLLNFYDGHDIWHFLSAGALFFSFLLVLLMDEDLNGKDRTKIAVF